MGNLIIMGIISYLLLYFILCFHEFGHAFFAIIFTKYEVKIRLGGCSDKKVFKIGRASICLNGFNPWYGTVEWDSSKVTNIKRAFIYLGGPIFSIILSIILWLLIRSNEFSYVNGNIIKLMFIFSIWQSIVTIIPIKYTKIFRGYNGNSSDGLNVLSILFKYSNNLE